MLLPCLRVPQRNRFWIFDFRFWIEEALSGQLSAVSSQLSAKTVRPEPGRRLKADSWLLRSIQNPKSKIDVVSSPGMGDVKPPLTPSQLSKRAARRIIQRAFVLAGRDRNVRQHIREATVTSLWIIEDWGLTWTLLINRGTVEFDRRPTRNPDLTFTWRTAEDFFKQTQGSGHVGGTSEVTGNLALRRFTDPVCHAFWASLRELLRNPVDECGDPLV
jgi:hypothetical protein